MAVIYRMPKSISTRHLGVSLPAAAYWEDCLDSQCSMLDDKEAFWRQNLKESLRAMIFGEIGRPAVLCIHQRSPYIQLLVGWERQGTEWGNICSFDKPIIQLLLVSINRIPQV